MGRDWPPTYEPMPEAFETVTESVRVLNGHVVTAGDLARADALRKEHGDSDAFAAGILGSAVFTRVMESGGSVSEDDMHLLAESWHEWIKRGGRKWTSSDTF